ncbi:MAG TPA: ABC transporter ATP-binding protein [Thermoanaerobaculia bacterium]|nr:ABC transporter ATP-binding protein [Thermoanaerobaculia bacterium]
MSTTESAVIASLPVPAAAVAVAAPAAPPIVELEGLEVKFGKRPILKGIDAALSGRCIGLLGPNGAGKTTLLHTLLGFHPPSAGTARIFGRDIRRDAQAIRGLMGYMPENDSFIAGMSGVRFVRLMAELSGLPPRQAMERAHEALFYVGLGEARYRPVGTYSLGMKQLAKLAQALAHGPRLLFLDEPTNGLDPPARERMLHLIRDIRDSGEVHVILSSHLLRDVEQCCEEVLVLKDGRLAVTCNLEEERRANRKFLELEVRSTAAAEGADGGPNGAFAAAAQELGCELAWSGKQRMKLVLPEGVEVRDLYRLAAERQVQIRRLDFKRDSLEDIFLQAMEGGHGGL